MSLNGDAPNIPEGERRPPDGEFDRSIVVAGSTASSIAAALRQLAAPPLRWCGRSWSYRRYGRHHRPVSSWYDLAGRVLQSWPVTLRIAILLLVVLTGTAEIAAKIGLSGQTIAIALDAWYCARRRYRQS